MMDNDYCVYVYCDPRKNNVPFYVGKGHKYRHNDHLRETIETTGNKRKVYKIESIRRDGQEPHIFKYAENLDEDRAYELEDFLITVWGRKDFDENGILFNIIEAGRRSPSISGPDHYNWGKPGAMLGKKLTDEQREKIRQSKLGKKRPKFSQEWLDKLAESNRGENNSMFGKKHRASSKKLMSMKAIGRKHLQTTKDKISESNRQRAIIRYQTIIPEIEKIIVKGITGYRPIAKELNDQGFKTARGAKWDDGGIKRVLKAMNEYDP